MISLLGENLIEFQFKGKTDAIILLSSCDGCDGYKIYVGGWHGDYSKVADGKVTGNLCDNTPKHHVCI